jgi:hypothetical protein
MKLGLMVAAASMLAVSAFAAVESGLKPGTPVGPFQVVDVNGPNKGKELCYRCQYGIAPVMAAFVNGDVAKSEQLILQVQKITDANKEKGLKSFVVYMGGPELKESIQKLAKEKKITVPLTFLPKGAKEGDIASYKISPKAKNTILLWKNSVRSNFVDVTSEKTGDVEKAVESLLKQ